MKSPVRTNRLAHALLVGLIMIISSTAANAADEIPQTTPEGMNLIKQTKARIVYAMPGASLGQYSKVGLLDCYVAFEKNWEQDYNSSASFGLRVSADDMAKIKKALADEFRKVFTEELTEAGHEIVDHTGPDVLVIRPAIINLNVSAPDVRSSTLSEIVVRSAGSMTLYMELFDSETSAIFGRVIDAQADQESFAERANSVTNKAAADRILRGWARELAGHLGAVEKDTAVVDE